MLSAMRLPHDSTHNREEKVAIDDATDEMRNNDIWIKKIQLNNKKISTNFVRLGLEQTIMRMGDIADSDENEATKKKKKKKKEASTFGENDDDDDDDDDDDVKDSGDDDEDDVKENDHSVSILFLFCMLLYIFMIFCSYLPAAMMSYNSKQQTDKISKQNELYDKEKKRKYGCGFVFNIFENNYTRKWA